MSKRHRIFFLKFIIGIDIELSPPPKKSRSFSKDDLQYFRPAQRLKGSVFTNCTIAPKQFFLRIQNHTYRPFVSSSNHLLNFGKLPSIKPHKATQAPKSCTKQPFHPNKRFNNHVSSPSKQGCLINIKKHKY